MMMMMLALGGWLAAEREFCVVEKEAEVRALMHKLDKQCGQALAQQVVCNEDGRGGEGRLPCFVAAWERAMFVLMMFVGSLRASPATATATHATSPALVAAGKVAPEAKTRLRLLLRPCLLSSSNAGAFHW